MTENFIDPMVFRDGIASTERIDHRVPWEKQYEVWKHGDGLVSRAESPRDLEVAVMQLHRALEQRDTLLNDLYDFQDIPHFGRAKYYAVMEELGLIRSSLKGQLRSLRNSIVHQFDDVPVDKQQCQYLSDVAWYYLKSTDRIAQQHVTEAEINYSGQDDAHFTRFTLKFTLRPFAIKVSGDIPAELLLSTPTPDCPIVKPQQSHSELYRGVSHFHFTGHLIGSQMCFKQVVKMFFEESAL
jgi:hypothetical protein